MGRYLCLISVFILSLIFSSLAHGQAYFQYDAEILGNLKEGTIRAVPCGDNYSRGKLCHELIPKHTSEAKQCFTSSRFGRFDRTRPLSQQTIYYITRYEFGSEFIYYWHDNDFIKDKRRWLRFRGSEWVELPGEGEFVDCFQPSKPKADLDNEIPHLNKFDMNAYGIESCLFAERTFLASGFDRIYGTYNRIRSFCFPLSSRIEASNLLDSYVELVKGDGYYTSLVDNEINGKYYTIRFNQEAISSPNICHIRMQVTDIDSDKIAEFYHLNSAEPEIPKGQAVLVFAVEERDCEAKADTVQ